MDTDLKCITLLHCSAVYVHGDWHVPLLYCKSLGHREYWSYRTINRSVSELIRAVFLSYVFSLHWYFQSHSFFSLPNPILGAYSSTLVAPKSYTE